MSLIIDALRRRTKGEARGRDARGGGVPDTLGFRRRPPQRGLSPQRIIGIAAGAIALGFLAVALPVYWIARQTARQQVIDELSCRDDDIIEIGSLAWLATSGRVKIGRDDRDQLCTFRNVRNDLAHRMPINDELLARVARYLGFERRPRNSMPRFDV